MAPTMDDLPVLSFTDGAALRDWLVINHDTSPGVWVRIFKRDADVRSVTFEDVLEQGLCFGWSESKRIGGDEDSYLQRFTPRRRQGTVSDRNKVLARRLSAEGKMTVSGFEALRMTDPFRPPADVRLISPRSGAASPPHVIRDDIRSDAAQPPNDWRAEAGDE